MSIWERMARVARSELSEMKRVLADKDIDPASEVASREAAIAEAEAELARAERDVLAAEIEMGSAGWGQASAAPPVPADELARGASLWGSGGAASTSTAPVSARPVVDATHGASTAQPSSPSPAGPPAAAGPARTIPTAVRDAHAALELPLGADAVAVHAAHASLSERFHPDRFGADAERTRIAAMVKARIDEARDQLLAWLAAR